MEFSIVGLAVSLALILLGGFYIFKPKPTMRLLFFKSKDYELSNTQVIWFKTAGLILAGLGIYYILVMVQVLPMINY